MIKPPPNVLELPLQARATLALQAAIEKVIEEHALEGLPLYVWRDERVVAVPPKICACVPDCDLASGLSADG